jgi:phospholipase/carboxylesterase
MSAFPLFALLVVVGYATRCLGFLLAALAGRFFQLTSAQVGRNLSGRFLLFPMSIPNTLLPAVELEAGVRPTYAVLWLHGLGADGHDFVPIVNELALPSAMSIRFVFPHAPMRPVSINQGMVMRAWHDYDMIDAKVGVQENMESLRSSQQAIEALIDRERQRGIKPENVVLAGFSQGGALALHTGLRYPERLAGVLALSCYLPAPTTLAAEAQQANSTTPIFMAHGRSDYVVPLVLAQASKRQLLESGYAVEWHEYSMAHTVSREEIDDIRDWLTQVLK